MNKDDVWISIDKIIRDVNRDMKQADEVERCQELNAKLNLETNKPKHKKKGERHE